MVLSASAGSGVDHELVAVAIRGVLVDVEPEDWGIWSARRWGHTFTFLPRHKEYGGFQTSIRCTTTRKLGMK